ncbi:hypothetical protein BDD12DRAFT_727014 [Trichophaea hybrida]|nr:hypothetical protein BDD12DRAFT_727014 [Trichophaea hybrida]
MAPHAENGTATPTATTNGTSPNNNSPPSPSSLKSFEHLKSYPLVADGINTFSSHPIGQRTIALSTHAYSCFIAPLSPYLSKAFPFVNKADEIADSSLEKIETRFPIVKEPTDHLKSVVVDSVGYPRKVVAEVIVRGQDFAKEKQEYVFKIYENEFSKIGEEDKKNGSYIPKAKAGITSAFVVSSDLMGAIAQYLGSKKEVVKEQAKEQAGNVKPEKN